MPKYEQLTSVEKELYHYEKEKYNATARLGADSLYFARPVTQGETWVPLVEKAWAKLHGDYASVMYGRTCDAIEDMTGYVLKFISPSFFFCFKFNLFHFRGVSSLILTKVHYLSSFYSFPLTVDRFFLGHS